MVGRASGSGNTTSRNDSRAAIPPDIMDLLDSVDEVFEGSKAGMPPSSSYTHSPPSEQATSRLDSTATQPALLEAINKVGVRGSKDMMEQAACML